MSYVQSRVTSILNAANKLDKERLEMCKHAIEKLAENIRKQKVPNPRQPCKNKKAFQRKIISAKKALMQLKELSFEVFFFLQVRSIKAIK